MRNRPQHPLHQHGRNHARSFDHAPQWRLAILYAAFVIPCVIIGVRLAWVQTVIPDRFLSGFDVQTEEFENVPARDGRILTSDGMVVACDVPRFDLEVHYRWLEEPPNDAWLRQQARSTLTPGDRRDPHLINAARSRVLARREAMLAALGSATNLPRDELLVRCSRIQERVERVYAYVSQLGEQRASAELITPTEQNEAPWWERGWRSFCRELTSSPERMRRDPLVIKEQGAYHVLIDDVPLAAVGAIESLPSQFPGVRVRLSTRRVYPKQEFAAHLLGVRTPITGEEHQARNEQYPDGDPLGYQVGDRIGRNGLERAYDSLLHGRAGLRRIVKDRHGVVLHSELVRAPTEGRDVVLSFDSHLQAQAEALLDDALQPANLPDQLQDPPADGFDAPRAASPPLGGCIVALDVRDGRILAAAAAPRFDINLLVDFDADQWEQANSDPRQPFFPRVTRMTVPPGSVFKILTSVALLESGLVDPDAMCHCRGYLDQPDRDRCLIYRHYGVGHGDMNLESALCQSCNVYFFQAARTIGPEPIHDWAVRFGLGRPSGCGIPGERGGNVPSPDAEGQAWYPGTTLQFAIGQASLTVTPLQVARMMAAVANDGVLVTPHFVSGPGNPAHHESHTGIQLAGFESAETLWPAQRIPGLSADTLWRIRAGLRRVVEDPRGTGKRIKLEQIALAGKTGTAEVGGGLPDHAWFAGYAPADDPRVAFVIVLEHGGSGGQVAGPVARRFVEAMLDYGTLRPDAD
jgi:penicillin-binding protein 2